MAKSDVSTVTHLLPTVNEGFLSALGSTIASGAAVVPLTDVSGLVNGSTFIGIIEPGAAKQQVFTGIVDTIGNQITGVKWTRGSNVPHSGGVTIVDYPTGTIMNMFSKWAATEHNDDGTHSDITATGLTVTGTTTLNGSFDSWIGANESWAFASSTTVTVPTNATTKYDIGDFIKFTQSSTVKYFVITALTATVLTVAGLAGATVANSAIISNYYSKSRNPHGAVAGAIPFNPYKFSVSRNTSLTTAASGSLVIIFNNVLFDTSSNYSVVNGRFTATVAGYYFFYARAGTDAGVAGSRLFTALYLNGNEVSRGSDIGNTSTNEGSCVSDFMQLAVGDYVQAAVYYSNSPGAGLNTGPGICVFRGFAVSAV